MPRQSCQGDRALARKKAAASRCRIRGQFRKDGRCLTFERGAPCKVAGQRRRERFRAGKDRACSGRVPRPLASPVPCRAADAFRKPRLFCGPSRADAVRPSPPFRAQAGFLAPVGVCHHGRVLSVKSALWPCSSPAACAAGHKRWEKARKSAGFGCSGSLARAIALACLKSESPPVFELRPHGGGRTPSTSKERRAGA